MRITRQAVTAVSTCAICERTLLVGERSVRITHPERVYFPATGATKLDLAQYYLSVGDGIVRALRERPCMLHRFPEGLSGEKVHQKRLPRGAPPWVETVQLLGTKGVKRVVECGPGKVLTGLSKRIVPDIEYIALQDSAALEAALK